MPIESGTTLAQLDSSWPLGGDSLNQGDNHLRLLKSVLKDQFPGALGLGYDIPITATEAELNFSSGVTSSIQTQINTLSGDVAANTAAISGLEGELSAPTGTAMAFFNAAAPNGWTQDVTNNNAMLRVVNTAGGGVGGSDSAILNNKVPSHTHGGTANSGGNHTHRLQFSSVESDNPNKGANGTITNTVGSTTQLMSTVHIATNDGAHTHTLNVTANSGAANWTPKYVDMIVAVKD